MLLDQGPGLLGSVWRFRLIVVATVIVLAGAAGALSLLQDPIYVAETNLLLADPNRGTLVFDPRNEIDRDLHIRQQGEVILSTPVLERAAALLQVADVRQLRERVAADASIDLAQVTLTASASTPRAAAQTADAFAQAYQQYVRDEAQARADAAVAELSVSTAALQERIGEIDSVAATTVLQAEREALVAELAALRSRSGQIVIEAALSTGGVELVEPAQLPLSPAQPQPLRNAILAAVLGLLAASAFAWWRAERFPRAERRDEPGLVLGAPLLGEVSEFAVADVPGPVPALSAPGSSVAEAYQFIVAALELPAHRTRGMPVLVTGPRARSGSTITALNIAVSAAQDGRRVVIVDADLRYQGLTLLVSSWAKRKGLTDLAAGDASLQESLIPRPIVSERGVSLVPTGSGVPDPAAFLRTSKFEDALRQICEAADLVIVDAPPLLEFADASAIATRVDAVLLTVRDGTLLEVIGEARERLERVAAPVLGYIFTRARGHPGSPRRWLRPIGAGGRERLRDTAEQRAATPESPIAEPTPSPAQQRPVRPEPDGNQPETAAATNGSTPTPSSQRRGPRGRFNGRATSGGRRNQGSTR